MTKTMAEVLAEHYVWYRRQNEGLGDYGWECTSLKCEYWTPNFSDAMAHQSAALTAAGYGLVADAKREAWDEGRAAAHDEMGRMYATQCVGDCDCNEPTPNPYRKASNDDQ